MIATRNIIRQLLALRVEPDPVRPQGCTPIGGPSCVLFDTFARHPREKMHGTSGQSMAVELVKVRPIESRNVDQLGRPDAAALPSGARRDTALRTPRTGALRTRPAGGVAFFVPLVAIRAHHSLGTAARKAEVGARQLLCQKRSFDHLVGEREQRGRNFEPECFGGFQIDHQLEFGRLLNRQI